MQKVGPATVADDQEFESTQQIMDRLIKKRKAREARDALLPREIHPSASMGAADLLSGMGSVMEMLEFLGGSSPLD